MTGCVGGYQGCTRPSRICRGTPRHRISAKRGRHAGRWRIRDVPRPGRHARAATALYFMAEALQYEQAFDILYSDEDWMNGDGPTGPAEFQAGLVPRASLGLHVLRPSVRRASASAYAEAGWFRDGFEGAQDYDLALASGRRWRVGEACASGPVSLAHARGINCRGGRSQTARACVGQTRSRRGAASERRNGSR